LGIFFETFTERPRDTKSKPSSIAGLTRNPAAPRCQKIKLDLFSVIFSSTRYFRHNGGLLKSVVSGNPDLQKMDNPMTKKHSEEATRGLYHQLNFQVKIDQKISFSIFRLIIGIVIIGNRSHIM